MSFRPRLPRLLLAKRNSTMSRLGLIGPLRPGIVTARRHHTQDRLRPRRPALLRSLAAIEGVIGRLPCGDQLQELVRRGLGESILPRHKNIASRRGAGLAAEKVGIGPGSSWLRRHFPLFLKASGEILERRHHRPVSNPAMIVPGCLLYTSPSPRDGLLSRMPSS